MISVHIIEEVFPVNLWQQNLYQFHAALILDELSTQNLNGG